MIKFTLVILCIFLSSILGGNSYAQTPVEEEMDPMEALRKIKTLLGESKAKTPTEEAEYYYQFEVDNKPCTHCPEFINLIKEVNVIAQKTPTNLSISGENKLINEISKLKFMYYESRSTLENGMVECNIFQNQNLLHPKGIAKDELSLLAEEVLEIKKVKSFHIYPQDTSEELRYYYRGEGAQANVVIEVVINKDQTALVRYHHYRPHSGELDYLDTLPTLGDTPQPKTIDDLNLNASLDVSDRLDLNTKSDIEVDTQKLEVALADKGGRKFVKLHTAHNNSGSVDVNAIVPLEFSLGGDKDLKLAGELDNGHSYNYQTQTKSVESKVRMALTDMNHDYLDATVMTDNELQKHLNLRSKFKLGNVGHVEAKFDKKDSSGIEKVSLGSKLHVSESARINGEINKDSNGAQDLNLGSNVKLGERVDLDASFYSDSYGKENVRFGTGIAVSKEVDLKGNMTRNEKGLDTISLGSRLDLGDNGSLTTDYIGNYAKDSDRSKKIAFGHVVTSNKTTYTSSVAVDSQKSTAFKFQAQKRISKNTSMSISLEHAQDNIILYQFESKF